MEADGGVCGGSRDEVQASRNDHIPGGTRCRSPQGSRLDSETSEVGNSKDWDRGEIGGPHGHSQNHHDSAAVATSATVKDANEHEIGVDVRPESTRDRFSSIADGKVEWNAETRLNGENCVAPRGAQGRGKIRLPEGWRECASCGDVVPVGGGGWGGRGPRCAGFIPIKVPLSEKFSDPDLCSEPLVPGDQFSPALLLAKGEAVGQQVGPLVTFLRSLHSWHLS